MQEFLDFLASIGANPYNSSDIKATGNIIRYRIEGHKAGSYNGRCTLWEYPDGFMAGWAMNMKEGIPHKWHSKATRLLSDEERREFAKRREAESRKFQEDKQSAAEKAAKTCEFIWKKSTEQSNHPYLVKKGLGGVKWKVAKFGALVIPAYKNGKIVSMQFINEKGEKKFKSGGDISGAYGSFGNNVEKIYISEGWATAKSISLAVAPFVSVYAFNAGNMKPVAQTMREKYPNAEIIICEDNDQWSRLPDGSDYNTGRIKGHEAALEVNALEIWPDFGGDDENHRTDFNDYHQTYGIEKLKLRLSQATVAGREIVDNSVYPQDTEVMSVVAPDDFPPTYSANDDWKSGLICKENGALVKGSLKNVILILENHPDFKNVFRLNEFQKEIYVHRAAPWDDESDFKVRRINDNDITNCTATVENIGLSSDNTKIFSAIKVVAERNGFHPAQEYFNALEWDKQSRLEKWLTYYMGAEDDDPEYLAFIGKKWLTAAVKRVFEPGCKFDHVLVAEGKQGKGKSTAFEFLATFGRDKKETYFTDNIKISDIQNKDTILLLQGSIIVELAELSGFNKKDDEEVKGWITIKEDRCRVPYGRTISIFPRQFVLCGTTNNYDYLKDPTGNRRYWPFKANHIDLEAIKQDAEQLWAEAVYYYKSGLYIGPSPEEMELAKIAQHKRVAIDPLEDDVVKAYNRCAEVSRIVKTVDILKEMGFILKDIADSRFDRKVNKILRQLGYENETIYHNGKSTRGWVKND